MPTEQGVDGKKPTGGVWPWLAALAAPLVLAVLVTRAETYLNSRLFLGSLLVLSGLAIAVLVVWEQVRGEISQQRVKALKEISDTLAALRNQEPKTREDKRIATDWPSLLEKTPALIQALTSLLQALTSLRQVAPEFFALLFAGWIIYLGLRALGYL